MISKFNNIYETLHQNCNEQLKQLEPLRTKARNDILIGVIAVVIIIAICTMFSYTTPIIMLLIFLVPVIFLNCLHKWRDYNKKYKQTVITALIKEYCEKLNYNQSMGISPYTYQKGQFESFDVFSSEDSITGILPQGYKIQMSEVHTQSKHRDSKGRTHYTTLFHGLFAEVEIGKNLNNHIKIRKNTIKIFDSKERIEMDSGEFEKIYDIYTKNKIETMQLFTSEILQMFVDFKNENKVTPELTIVNDNLYIRVETGNVFEANMFKEALDYSTLKNYYDTIDFTLGITEKLLKNIKETEI